MSFVVFFFCSPAIMLLFGSDANDRIGSPCRMLKLDCNPKSHFQGKRGGSEL
ncbi:hypothetical protein WAI453_005210 [Rhynchosporium graminicola]